MPGISGGERKRVSVATAIVVGGGSKRVLLLDEPTSGLDAQTAAEVRASWGLWGPGALPLSLWKSARRGCATGHDLPSCAHTQPANVQVMRCLRQLADRRRLALLAAVHSPSETVFHMLDCLTVMAGGRVAYSGDPGAAAGWLRAAAGNLAERLGPAGGDVASIGHAEVVSEVAHKARASVLVGGCGGVGVSVRVCMRCTEMLGDWHPTPLSPSHRRTTMAHRQPRL